MGLFDDVSWIDLAILTVVNGIAGTTIGILYARWDNNRKHKAAIIKNTEYFTHTALGQVQSVNRRRANQHSDDTRTSQGRV